MGVREVVRDEGHWDTYTKNQPQGPPAESNFRNRRLLSFYLLSVGLEFQTRERQTVTTISHHFHGHQLSPVTTMMTITVVFVRIFVVERDHSGVRVISSVEMDVVLTNRSKTSHCGPFRAKLIYELTDSPRVSNRI